MENVALVQDLYDAFGRRDYDRVREIFDPEIEWLQMEGFPGGGIWHGPDEIFANVFDRLKDDWRSWRVGVSEYLDAGDVVIVLGNYEATYKESGGSFRAPFAHLYRLRDGRIYRFEQYTDTKAIADAAG